MDSEQIEKARKDLEARRGERIAALAVACFFQATVPNRCTPNGPPVTSAAFLLSRYVQNQLVSPNGSLSQGAVARRQVEARASQLRALLDRMAQDIADAPLDSVAKIEVKYGAQFSMYSGPGLNTDIGDFVFRALTDCFAKSQSSVQNELMRANTELGKLPTQIQLATQR